jgi:N-methylhydantoinase A
VADELLALDVGGTFTDAVLRDRRSHETARAKAPTTPADRTRGVVDAAQRVLDQADLDPSEVDRVLHGTTTATNALLEGQVGRTALVTNEGFEDVLEIGRQQRPSLYDLDQAPPEPLVPRELRFGIGARLDATGEELAPVDPDELATVADQIAAADPPVEAVAVGLLHAHRSADHEREVADRLEARLEVPVVTSHGTSPEPREVERLSTTVVDASLRGLVGDYLARLENQLASIGLAAPIRVLDSAAATVSPDEIAAHPVHSVLSGPAGGGAANRHLARSTDADPLVGVDVGGTSTDVSLVQAGEASTRWRVEVAGRPLQIPAVDVHTIGAGGGSIAHRDEAGGLQVGPESAGAQPGPACYDRGGQRATLTDAQLALGRIPPSAALAGELALDADAARQALARLGEAPVDELARQVLEIALARTVRGLRTLTARHAVDPERASLAAFGGAGPQLGAAWARRLGFGRLIVPPAAGVTSAKGLLTAPARVERSQGLLVPAEDLDPAEYGRVTDELAARARDGLPEADTVDVRHLASARYAGQSHELTVPVPERDPARIREAFETRHETKHGYTLPDPVEVVTLRVRAQAPPLLAPATSGKPSPRAMPNPVETVDTAFVDHPDPVATPVYEAERVEPGARFEGPAILASADTTALVPPDAQARVHGTGALIVTWEGSA